MAPLRCGGAAATSALASRPVAACRGVSRSLSSRPVLRPGLRVFRRDDSHLQVGIEEPRVVLPDDDGVRRLLHDLEQRRRTAVADARRRASRSARLVDAGLVVDRAELSTAARGGPSSGHGSGVRRPRPRCARARLELPRAVPRRGRRPRSLAHHRGRPAGRGRADASTAPAHGPAHRDAPRQHSASRSALPRRPAGPRRPHPPARRAAARPGAARALRGARDDGVPALPRRAPRRARPAARAGPRAARGPRRPAGAVRPRAGARWRSRWRRAS